VIEAGTTSDVATPESMGVRALNVMREALESQKLRAFAGR